MAFARQPPRGHQRRHAAAEDDDVNRDLAGRGGERGAIAQQVAFLHAGILDRRLLLEQAQP